MEKSSKLLYARAFLELQRIIFRRGYLSISYCTTETIFIAALQLYLFLIFDIKNTWSWLVEGININFLTQPIFNQSSSFNLTTSWLPTVKLTQESIKMTYFLYNLLNPKLKSLANEKWYLECCSGLSSLSLTLQKTIRAIVHIKPFLYFYLWKWLNCNFSIALQLGRAIREIQLNKIHLVLSRLRTMFNLYRNVSRKIAAIVSKLLPTKTGRYYSCASLHSRPIQKRFRTFEPPCIKTIYSDGHGAIIVVSLTRFCMIRFE